MADIPRRSLLLILVKTAATVMVGVLLLAFGLAALRAAEPRLTQEVLGGKQFRFSWETENNSALIGTVNLNNDGTIAGIRSPNETTWQIDDQGRLLFRHRDGRVSTVFTHAQRQEGKWHFSGPFQFREGVQHVLEEILRPPAVALEDGTPTRADSRANNVLFEFYSSCEEEMSLAYCYELPEHWRFVKMRKEGNRFFVYQRVDDRIWYEFVASPNVWFKRDPLNGHVNSDHPYLNRGLGPLATSRNLNVKYVASEHFDYFTRGDGKKIDELEAIYAKVTDDLLTMFAPHVTPVHGKKIRYYGGIFKGRYATAASAEIIEEADFPNSHEIIHTLLHAYPRSGPFVEGIAQCLQQSGNQRPLSEDNCSLAAKEKSKKLKLWDVLSDFEHHNDYHMAGSFIYYHLFIVPGARKQFVAFLKEFKSGENTTFEDVVRRYHDYMGKPLEIAVAEWEQWVSNVTASSPVYVNWDMSGIAAARKCAEPFVGNWRVGRPGGSDFVISLYPDFSAGTSVARGVAGRWAYMDGEARIQWRDGSCNVIRREGSTYRKLFFKAGMPPGSQPVDSSAAKKM